MAKEDYNVADRDLSANQSGLTAGEKIAGAVWENPDVDAREAADAAGVSHAAYIDYAAALTTFESRDDIEPLAARRARDVGETFADGDFMRDRVYQGGGTYWTPAAPEPGPHAGDVQGDADKNA